jgi:hypothetical protein
MAHRPPESKQRRRVAKALRREMIPARFSVVDWLMQNGHASTKREARSLIIADRVTAASHPIRSEFAPVVLRKSIVVTAAKDV